MPRAPLIDYSLLSAYQTDPYWREKMAGGPLGEFVGTLAQIPRLREEQAAKTLERYLTLGQIYPELRPGEREKRAWDILMGQPTWFGLGPPRPATVPMPEKIPTALEQYLTQLSRIAEIVKQHPELAKTLGFEPTEAEKTRIAHKNAIIGWLRGAFSELSTTTGKTLKRENYKTKEELRNALAELSTTYKIDPFDPELLAEIEALPIPEKKKEKEKDEDKKESLLERFLKSIFPSAPTSAPTPTPIPTTPMPTPTSTPTPTPLTTPMPIPTTPTTPSFIQEYLPLLAPPSTPTIDEGTRLRQLAIQGLQEHGIPITEANIRKAIEILKRKGY